MRWPSWRAPVLGLICIQYGAHSINHLVDIGHAHPYVYGPLNFGLLVLATAQLAWLCRIAAQQSHGSAETGR